MSLGQQLAALRRHHERVCPICGKPFTGYAKQIYCGKLCRDRAAQRAAYRKRRARAEAQPQP